MLEVLTECEGTIKEETQVSPCGAWVKRGGPSVGGITKVNVRVTVTVFLGEVESSNLLCSRTKPMDWVNSNTIL
jgi:hypothetical protein